MGEVTGVDDDDYIAPTGATEHKKPAPKKKKEETKEVGGGYVDMKDLPEEVRAQIEAMNLGDDVKVKKDGNEYKIEYVASSSSHKPSAPKKADHKAPAKKSSPSAEATADGDEDEPVGYISKSVSTQTKTCGSKTTKTVTKVYKFADGSTQTFTTTETHN